MSKYKVGDTIVNPQGVTCTVVEHQNDFYLIKAPDDSLENITEQEIEALEKHTEN